MGAEGEKLKMRLPAVEVGHYTVERRPGEGTSVGCMIHAGNDGPDERLQEWNGEDGEVPIKWRRRVDVHVSPTGRSVRVFVDGEEVPPRA